MDATLREPRKSTRSLSRIARESRKEYIQGIFLLLIVVFLWTSSSFLTQDLFDWGFDKPFWLTYLSTGTFALYLFPPLVRRFILGETKNVIQERGREGYRPISNQEDVAPLFVPDFVESPETLRGKDNLPPLTTRETAKLAGWFCLLWFIANWTLTVALGYTTVASATILSSMSGFFTLALGRMFRVEKLTLIKILAVVTSFGGVVLVSLADSAEVPPPGTIPPVEESFVSSSRAPIVGDALALLSALFYALYVILLKVRVRSESRVDMQLFFGFVGLFNLIACLPIGIILHVARIERFEIPNSRKVIVAILISMFITLSSDYLYVLAMLKTTPLVVTIGLSLTMPLAVVGDFVMHKPVKVQVILGAVVVLLSFVAVGLESPGSEDAAGLVSGQPPDEEFGDASLRLEEEVVPDALPELQPTHS